MTEDRPRGPSAPESGEQAPERCEIAPGGWVARRCPAGQRTWDRYAAATGRNMDPRWFEYWLAYERHGCGP